MVRLQIAPSIAPVAPSAWPCKPLVPLTGTRAACSPSASLIASVSVGSLSGVEEACALT